jgi:hypothetical protein
MTGLIDEIQRFIRSIFRSILTLDVLIALKRYRRICTAGELISSMRASEKVVTQALEGLIAAGLVSFEGGGAVYMPVNEEVAACVDQVQSLYAIRPDAVRRVIVAASTSGVAAFADAFRLRKE